VYELFEVDKNTTCRVRRISTPHRAAMLLEYHGETPENGKNTSSLYSDPLMYTGMILEG